MPLSIGIVGLPNVGKSTTFNALTEAQNAEAANYPFCTIEPNKAIVPLPDDRLEALASLIKPEKVLYATVEFVDIAGLVKGASQGEGLGNQFLGNIRETSAIVHVVRCFEDPNVIHVSGAPDPKEDIEVINTELALADLQSLEKKIERITKQMKFDKKMQAQLDIAQEVKDHLLSGGRVAAFPGRASDACEALCEELRFITDKKVIYAANVDEATLAQDNALVATVREIADAEGAEVVKLCAKIEEEMSGMSREERQEFLTDMGVTESGLGQIVRKGFHALGLITYITAGPKEVRAWTIPRGCTAPKAAGVIHTDFERGFIRAEVIAFDSYMKHKGEAGVKAAGEMRVEGKDYIVQDGDIMHFRFNV